MRGEGRLGEQDQSSPEQKDYAEITKYQKNFIEMDLDSDDPDVLELKNRIAKYNGTVRIMVHPLFEFNEESRKEVFPRAEETERGLKTLIAKGKEGSPAMFIFEESRSINQTQEYLQNEIKQAGNVIYYIPTAASDPRPDILEIPGNTDELPGAWNRIYAMFQKAGVKEALIGGIILKMFKTYESDKLNPDEANFLQQRAEQGAQNLEYTLEGCVGMTIRKLSDRGMKTHLSNFFSADYELNRSKITKAEKMRSPNYPKDSESSQE